MVKFIEITLLSGEKMLLNTDEIIKIRKIEKVQNAMLEVKSMQGYPYIVMESYGKLKKLLTKANNN